MLLNTTKKSSDIYFKTEHLSEELGNLSVRGGVVTVFEKSTDLVLKLGSTAILARLLTPTDFGLVAMVSAITGIMGIVINTGLFTATVQKAEVTHLQVSTLFWVSAAFGLASGLFVAAISPLISILYGDSSMIKIALVLAIAYPLSGLSIQHEALLARQMRFGTLAGIRLSSETVGVFFAIFSALLGAKYWALIIMRLSAELTKLILIWITCRWIPALPRRRTGIRSMLAFGGYMSLSTTVSMLMTSIDRILLGHYWGTAAVGYYSKAFQLFSISSEKISGPLEKIIVPTLCRLQKDSTRFRRYFMQFVEIVSAISLPISLFLVLWADEIVLTLFGEQWKPSIALLRGLSPGIFFFTIAHSSITLYKAFGHTKKLLKINIVNSIIIIIGITIGLKYGVLGVSIGVGLSLVITQPITIIFAISFSPVSVKDILLSIRRPLFVTFISGLITWLVMKNLLKFNEAYYLLAFSIMLFSLSYILAWLITPGGQDIFNLIKKYGVLWK